MLSADELQRAQAEISEDELEGVDGGGMPPIPPGVFDTKVQIRVGCAG